MALWLTDLKYFLPPEISGPLVDLILFQSKRLIQSLNFVIRTNILRRSVGNNLR